MNSEFGVQNSEANMRLGEDGFEILTDVLSARECEVLASEPALLYEKEQASTKNKIGGVRNLPQLSPQVAELASSPRLRVILESRLGKNVFSVRALFFDKTAGANWRVPWHQDLTIAVVERIETPGFNAWSVKEGVVHVQPPREILEGMATIRLHLDDCDADNGALRVVPASHLRGRLSAIEIGEWTKGKDAVFCEVPKGGALLMHPFLLHSSLPAKKPVHRRVLHIEYATDELPNGLKLFDC